ncbi:MAG: helix-turn-helix domain-containing protein [Haloferacaceae archaeon]
MSGGVRAEVAVHGPTDCPVAALSADRDAAATGVTWARNGDEVAEEFRMGSDGGDGGAGGADVGDHPVRPVVDVGDRRVYRFEREAGAGCACETVESAGVPVADVRAESGVLVLTLHLEGVEPLREVLPALRAGADRVEVRSLVRTAPDRNADGSTARAPTLLDPGRLTDRQREVLRTAHGMGYFEYPRRASAEAVAAELDIAPSTFAEHLAAAQGRLLDDLLSD